MNKATMGVIGMCFVIALVVLAVFSIFTVPAGKVGVVTRWGAVNRVVYPGVGIKIPFVEGIRKMDVRMQLYQIDCAAASNDSQTVTSTVALNYHIDGLFATNIFQNIGMNYEEILIDPALENVFKDTTAQYDASELITKRETVRLHAEDSLSKLLIEYHIVVDNLNIVNFDFSPEYNEAIEQKQVAQQEVETAKEKKAKAVIDAERALIEAQAQAAAQAALKDAGALSPEYLQYLAITKWNGILPTVTGGAIPFIDITELD